MGLKTWAYNSPFFGYGLPQREINNGFSIVALLSRLLFFKSCLSIWLQGFQLNIRFLFQT
jgi:hypothetical protein